MKNKIDMEEQRIDIFNRAGWICEVCGKSLNHYGTPQLAHRIPQKKYLLKLYGEEVIHHRLNLAPVCSLECNSAVLIEGNIEKREYLLDRIYDDLDKSGA